MQLKPLIVSLIVTFSAKADVYSVSNAAQIASVMASALPGDTLVMTNGTWMNAQIVFQGNGDSLHPIVLRAEIPGQVVITGTSYLRIAGTWLVVDGLRFENGVCPSGSVIEFRSPNGTGSDHCRLTNSSIVDYNPPDSLTDYKWVSLYGSYNRVDHCYFAGKRHSGTTLVVWLGPTPNYHRIDRNHFGPRPPLGINGGETIRVGTSDWSMYDSFTTVEENYFNRCNGEAEIISSKSCGNVYRANTFDSCAGALTLRHGNRCRVEGNFFFGNKVKDSGGIRVIGEDHVVVNNYLADLAGSSMKSALPVMNGVPDSPLNRYFRVQRALIAFNTFVDCKVNLLIGAGKDTELTLPPLNCVIANNIVRSTYGPLIQYADTPVNMIYAGNLFHGASLGIAQPAGITVSDPKLIKDTAGIWRPGSDSPAIGQAVPTEGDVTIDMDGQARASTTDIGADQSSIAPVTSRPLTTEDAGPGWMHQTTKVVSHERPIPTGFSLLQNFPNPFNPVTRVRYTVQRPGSVRLDIVDLNGQVVDNIEEGIRSPGSHEAIWDAKGHASGTYFLLLTSPEGVRTRKVVLLK